MLKFSSLLLSNCFVKDDLPPLLVATAAARCAAAILSTAFRFVSAATTYVRLVCSCVCGVCVRLRVRMCVCLVCV
jgi:hypothetical protein